MNESGPTLRLACWRRSDHDVEIDPQTGDGRMIRLEAPRVDYTEISGYGQPERGVAGAVKFFAVYRREEEILFHAGARRWRLGSSGLRLEHEHRFPLVSRFRVVEGERQAFSFLYTHAARSVLALVDPTYGQRDRDQDFFLEFLAGHAHSPDWLHSVRERWKTT